METIKSNLKVFIFGVVFFAFAVCASLIGGCQCGKKSGYADGYTDGKTDTLSTTTCDGATHYRPFPTPGKQ